MNTEKEIIEALSKPLPKEAIKPQTHKPQFSSINATYVMERLNEVLGLDWELRAEVIDKAQDASKGKGYMVVVKATFIHRRLGIHREQFGGNDNMDLGDAYKGAVTDALTKIASGLGVGAHVFKGDPYPREYASKHEPKQDAPPPPTYEQDLSKAGGKHSKVALAYAQMLGMEAPKMASAEEAEMIARKLHEDYWKANK